MQFLTYLYNKENFDDVHEDLLSLIALSSFNSANKMQEMIKNTIILNMISEYVIKEDEYKTSDECECNECHKSTDEDEIDIKSYFENKITHFNPEDEIDYPPEGQTQIIHYRDNISFPGKTYSMDFLIDHSGRVLKMIGMPIQINTEKPNFNEIYAGLVGDILEHQQIND